MVVPCAKFGQILEIFGIFQIFNFPTQKIGLDVQCHHHCAFHWSTFWRKGLYIWIQHQKIRKPKTFHQFWRRSRPPKGKKTPKKCPLCHFLDPHEAILVESTFEGSNQLQIRKFKVFKKLDRQGFPKSYLGFDLVVRKASKSII